MRYEVKAGAQEESYYVVKFQNNPQGARILANELLGTRLAASIGLPAPATSVVEVGVTAAAPIPSNLQCLFKVLAGISQLAHAFFG